MNEEIAQRFNTIEKLILDLKSTLTSKYEEIDKRLEKVIDSQNFISSEFDKFKTITDKLMTDNVALRKDNDNLNAKVTALEKDIEAAHAATNDLEQYGRRSMLEIAGIPRTSEENTEQLVINLCSKLNLEVSPKDIEAAHRTSTKESANIIVMFTNRKLRNLVLSKRSQLRKVTTHDLGLITERSASKIFINESLTRRNKELFGAALKIRKDQHYKYIWTRNGKIFLRQTDGSRVINIASESDLQKL